MSIYYCNSCSACGGKCDQCTLDVCLNNMERHREIYKLINEFENKINYVIENVYDKCIEIKKNLSNNYGINIEISDIYDKIIENGNFLNKMKDKKEEIQNNINEIKKRIEIIKKENLDKINKLNEIHKKKIEEMDKIYKEKEKIYIIDKSKYEEIIKSKKEIINNLSNEKDKNNINIDEIIKDYINEEKIKLEKEFNDNKNNIDINYIYNEKELKYSQEELEKKNNYLNEIRRIKFYSDKIPNYENWIKAFKLNKYFN